MKKVLTLIMVLVLSLGVLSACGGNSAKKEIKIGSKNFTENQLLSRITALYLEKNGYKVTESKNMGSAVLHTALQNKQLDLYWEYTGTALVNFLKQAPEADSQKAFDTVKKLDESNKITWLNMTGINNTYSMAMLDTDVKAKNIHTISDLAKYVNDHPGEFKVTVGTEFAVRPDGLPGLEKSYGFSFGPKNVLNLEQGIQYPAIKKGEVNVVEVYSTDPRVKQFNLTILKDDKKFFPAYNAAASFNTDSLKANPKLEQLTADIAKKLTEEEMINLVYKIDIDGGQLDQVAQDWIKGSGLLK